MELVGYNELCEEAKDRAKQDYMDCCDEDITIDDFDMEEMALNNDWMFLEDGALVG